MTFLANMEILKGSFPDVWQTISEMEDRLDKGLVRVLTNKEGLPTLKVGNQFIHDKNKPLQEARNYIGQLQNVKEHSDFVFYGLGLGYQIKAFVEQYPHTPFSIYEPVPEIFYQFLCHIDLRELPLHLLRNIYLESKPEDLEMYSSIIVRRIRKTILIIELPAYHSVFPEKRQAFFTRFTNLIAERRRSLATTSAFEKRWTINSLKNFVQVLNTPNILLQKKGAFINKPALLVASGPSLEDEIENLKTIKDRGLAYIFAVGTAVNTLIQHGIHPHAACTYDPTPDNQSVFKDFPEKGIDFIPLIFGSTVGYETLEKYPGPQIHMLISQDALAAFYLKPENGEEIEYISDAATIAVITLQLLYKLGFNPIILAGLNLAYREGKRYVAGSTFFPPEASKTELNNAIPVRDVYGNEVASNNNFIGMRRQLEAYLEYYQDVEVINTTRYGAHIEGTSFQHLDEVIKDRLQERMVEDDWLEGGKPGYNMDHLIEKHRIMKNAYSRVARLLEQCKFNLDGINQTAESQDASLIGQSYDLFNRKMDELRNNLFFSTFIVPMNRVEMEFLMLAVPEISRELNPTLKAQMMENEFRPFLQGCERDLNTVGPLFQELDRSLQELYKSYTIRQKAARIKILLIDGEGVLTDGAIYLSSSGDEAKRFHGRDRAGILRLREKGIQSLLLNPDDDPILGHAARKLGIDTIYSGDNKQALTLIREKFEQEEVACIWGETGDLAWLGQVGLSFAVNSAPPDLKNAVDYVLTAGGGEGALKEIADLI